MTADAPADRTEDSPRSAGFLGLRGRGSRREFALGAGLLVALEGGFIAFLEATFPEGLGGLALITFPFFMAPIVGVAVFATRRLHDLGWPAMLIWCGAVAIRLLLIPLQWAGLGDVTDEIGLGLMALGLLWLACLPRSEEANEFGPPPKSRSLA